MGRNICIHFANFSPQSKFNLYYHVEILLILAPWTVRSTQVQGDLRTGKAAATGRYHREAAGDSMRRPGSHKSTTT